MGDCTRQSMSRVVRWPLSCANHHERALGSTIFSLKKPKSVKFVTLLSLLIKMKFSLLAVVAATCAAPTGAEFFLKEQFNDDVSQSCFLSCA